MPLYTPKYSYIIHEMKYGTNIRHADVDIFPATLNASHLLILWPLEIRVVFSIFDEHRVSHKQFS